MTLLNTNSSGFTMNAKSDSHTLPTRPGFRSMLCGVIALSSLPAGDALALKSKQTPKRPGFLETYFGLGSYKDRALKSVCADGLALENYPDLGANFDVVFAAVSQNGLALKHASKELRDELDVVLAAVTKDYRSLKYASPRLQFIMHANGRPEAMRQLTNLQNRYRVYSEERPFWVPRIEHCPSWVPMEIPRQMKALEALAEDKDVAACTLQREIDDFEKQIEKAYDAAKKAKEAKAGKSMVEIKADIHREEYRRQENEELIFKRMEARQLFEKSYKPVGPLAAGDRVVCLPQAYLPRRAKEMIRLGYKTATVTSIYSSVSLGASATIRFGPEGHGRSQCVTDVPVWALEQVASGKPTEGKMLEVNLKLLHEARETDEDEWCQCKVTAVTEKLVTVKYTVKYDDADAGKCFRVGICTDQMQQYLRDPRGFPFCARMEVVDELLGRVFSQV